MLLLNLGGPDKLDDVQPFLYNLFADPDIIRLPKPLQWLQKPIATFAAAARAPQVRKIAYIIIIIIEFIVPFRLSYEIKLELHKPTLHPSE